MSHRVVSLPAEPAADDFGGLTAAAAAMLLRRLLPCGGAV